MLDGDILLFADQLVYDHDWDQVIGCALRAFKFKSVSY